MLPVIKNKGLRAAFVCILTVRPLLLSPSLDLTYPGAMARFAFSHFTDHTHGPPDSKEPLRRNHYLFIRLNFLMDPAQLCKQQALDGNEGEL